MSEFSIAFDVVIFLRTDKDIDSCGHPVDRIDATNFVEIFYEKNQFTPDHDGFVKFRTNVTQELKKYLFGCFQPKVLLCSTAAGLGEHSQIHAIRVDDIRNIVARSVDERIQNTFESIYEYSI